MKRLEPMLWVGVMAMCFAIVSASADWWSPGGASQGGKVGPVAVYDQQGAVIVPQYSLSALQNLAGALSGDTTGHLAQCQNCAIAGMMVQSTGTGLGAWVYVSSFTGGIGGTTFVPVH